MNAKSTLTGVCPKHGIQQAFTFRYQNKDMKADFSTPDLCPVCWIDWATSSVTNLEPLNPEKDTP